MFEDVRAGVGDGEAAHPELSEIRQAPKAHQPPVGNLGVREFAMLLFFRPFGVDDAQIVQAGILLFFINVLLPALFGVWPILRWGLQRERDL